MPVGRGVGPSVVGQLLRDRSLRLAAGLAVGVAHSGRGPVLLPVPIAADLGQLVGRRPAPAEPGDGRRPDQGPSQDALQAPRRQRRCCWGCCRTRPSRSTSPFIQTTFDAGSRRRAVRHGFYVWSDVDGRASRRAARLRSRQTRSFVADPAGGGAARAAVPSELAPAEARDQPCSRRRSTDARTYFQAQLRFAFAGARDR